MTQQSNTSSSHSLVRIPQADLNKLFITFYSESALFVRLVSSVREMEYHFLPEPRYGVFNSTGDLVADYKSAEGAQEWVRMEGCYPVWMH